MSTIAASKNLESGGRIRVYDAVADTDVTTAYQGYTTGRRKLPVRWFIFFGGALVIKDLNGDTSTLPVACAGTPFPGQISELVAAGSGATCVVLIW